jgi:hypothetical protein
MEIRYSPRPSTPAVLAVVLAIVAAVVGIVIEMALFLLVLHWWHWPVVSAYAFARLMQKSAGSSS